MLFLGKKYVRGKRKKGKNKREKWGNRRNLTLKGKEMQNGQTKSQKSVKVPACHGSGERRILSVADIWESNFRATPMGRVWHFCNHFWRACSYCTKFTNSVLSDWLDKPLVLVLAQIFKMSKYFRIAGTGRLYRQQGRMTAWYFHGTLAYVMNTYLWDIVLWDLLLWGHTSIKWKKLNYWLDWLVY